MIKLIFRTHLVFGLFLGLLFLRFFKNDWIIFLLIVCFSSVLADIDYPKSKIGKNIKLVSWLLNKILGHRGFLHTIYPLVFVFLLLIFLKQNLFGYAFLIGYSSHLFLDMLTKQGIGLFYPVFKIKLKGFIKSGGKLEFIIFYFVLFLDFLYVIINFLI